VLNSDEDWKRISYTTKWKHFRSKLKVWSTFEKIKIWFVAKYTILLGTHATAFRFLQLTIQQTGNKLLNSFNTPTYFMRACGLTKKKDKLNKI